MKNLIKHTDLYIGQLVVTNDHPEAVVYTIASIEPTYKAAVLNWFEGNHKCTGTHEYFSFYKPTLKQIENHIAMVGRLASTQDI
jgi:hypothetical protein